MARHAFAAAAIALAWLACAPGGAPAVAQETEQQLPNPDPAQPPPPSPTPAPTFIPFSRESAEALVAESRSSAQFEVIALEEGKFGVRHRGSGVVCRFVSQRQNRINVTRAEDPESHVGCVTGPFPVTLTAALNDRVSTDIALRALAATFREENPNARTFEPAGDYWPEAPRRARYLHLVSQNDRGELNVLHAVAIRRGDWTIICRFSFTSQNDLVLQAAEIAAAAYFATIFSDLETHSPQRR